jgi:RimJ/RimL family protein N-acetyltransferase
MSRPPSGLPWRPRLPLLTERLELRAHNTEDVDDLLVFHSDPEVVRFIPWPVRSREQVAESLAVKITRTAVEQPGEWIVLAMQLRATGQVIGEVLLKYESDEVAELGYAVARQFHGLGLASEAASAMLALAFDEFGVNRIVAKFDSRNSASQALLERLGFRFVRDHHAEFKGELALGFEYELVRP